MPDDADHSYTEVARAIAEVRFEPNDPAVGLAFAVDVLHVVTCAHVVNRALGRPADDRTRPAPRADLWLRFLLGGGERRARVATWWPRDDGPFEQRDVAVLALGEDLPRHVVVPRLVRHRPDGAVTMFSLGGQDSPQGYVDGRVKGRTEVGVHVEVDASGDIPVEQGFSGGPIWRPRMGDVIGMVHGRAWNRQRVIYGVSANTIAAAWPDLTPLPWEREAHGDDESDDGDGAGDNIEAAPQPDDTDGMWAGLLAWLGRVVAPARGWLLNPWVLMVSAIFGVVGGCEAERRLSDGPTVGLAALVVVVLVYVVGVGTGVRVDGPIGRPDVRGRRAEGTARTASNHSAIGDVAASPQGAVRGDSS